MIEKSAYDSLEESLILAKKQRDEFHVQVNELKDDNERLLDKIHEERIISHTKYMALMADVKAKLDIAVEALKELNSLQFERNDKGWSFQYMAQEALEKIGRKVADK